MEGVLHDPSVALFSFSSSFFSLLSLSVPYPSFPTLCKMILNESEFMHNDESPFLLCFGFWLGSALGSLGFLGFPWVRLGVRLVVLACLGD